MAGTARAAGRPRAARGRTVTSGPLAGAPTALAGIRWDRVARVMLLLVLAAVLLSYLGPGLKYFHAWRLSRAESAEIRQLRRENIELEARARLLRDPRHLELEARKLGMARPGERAYVVKNLPPD